MVDFKSLLSNEWFRLAGTLLIGITIGAIFYPTKRIEEKVSQKYEQEIAKLKQQHIEEDVKVQQDWIEVIKAAHTRIEEAEKKVSSLTIENKELKSKQKTAKYKIVRPDGTIEEQEFTETETQQSSQMITQIQEEFKTKITQIEEKWETVHINRVTALHKEFTSKELEYQKTIASLEKSKTTTINEKSFGIEAGIMDNKNYYGHAAMDLWGPIFVGVHGELGNKDGGNKLGAGLGFRF